MKSAVKLKPKAHTYETWLWNLSKEERAAHFAAVKEIVASRLRRDETVESMKEKMRGVA